MRYVDGQVAEKQYVACFGIRLQRLPLAIEQELFEDHLPDHPIMLAAGIIHSLRLMVAQGFGPLPPGQVAIRSLDGREEGEIIQPALVGLLKTLHLASQFRVPGNRLPEAFAGLSPERQMRPRRVTAQQGIAFQPTQPGAHPQIDQVGIAGEGGERFVGRVVAVGWSQRQELPDAEAAGDEAVDETPGLLSQNALRKRAGQGGDM